MRLIKQLLTWLFNSNGNNLRIICEIIDAIKRFRNTKDVVYVSDLIPKRFTPQERSKLSELTRNVLYEINLAKEAKTLPSALKSLRAMDQYERHQTYEDLGGHLMADLSGLDFKKAKSAVKNYYDSQFKPMERRA